MKMENKFNSTRDLDREADRIVTFSLKMAVTLKQAKETSQEEKLAFIDELLHYTLNTSKATMSLLAHRSRHLDLAKQVEAIHAQYDNAVLSDDYDEKEAQAALVQNFLSIEKELLK